MKIARCRADDRRCEVPLYRATVALGWGSTYGCSSWSMGEEASRACRNPDMANRDLSWPDGQHVRASHLTNPLLFHGILSMRRGNEHHVLLRYDDVIAVLLLHVEKGVDVYKRQADCIIE